MNRNGWSDAQLMATMADAVACISTRDAMETRKNMVNAGFEQLGNGNFAAAFTRPDMKGYVIKITKGNDNFPAYVYWAMANPGPAVPEYKFPFLSTQPIVNKWSGSENDRQFAVMMPAYESDTYKVQVNGDYQAAESILHGWANDQCDYSGPMAQASKAMRQFFGNSVSWDLHGANVMIDPLDGSFKITDPFCGELDYNQLHQLTGNTYYLQPEPIQENLFPPDRAAAAHRVWPRPAYADRVVEVARPQAQRMGGLPPAPRGAVAARAAMNKIKPMFDNLNQQWVMPDGFHMNMEAIPMFEGRLDKRMGLKPVMIGDRAANKRELAELGKFLQGEDLMKLFRAGHKEIEVCLAPTMPAFLRLAARDPLKPVTVKRVRLSLAQAEYLQGQFKVNKINLDCKNFGKGWQPPILNL